MARLIHPDRALSTNPLKVSAPLGAAMAYLGIEGAIPLFHGAQGCTAFAMVHMVRHFKEAIPLQTTAMNEVSAILGGGEQIEEAIENIRKRANPKFIGIASTALVETRGEDVAGELREMLRRRTDFSGTTVVYAATPDFAGGLEDGWARAVEAIIDALAVPCTRRPGQVNLLPGSHMTSADVEEVAGLVRAFGLNPVILPDISLSLDGHLAEDWRGHSLGGTKLVDIATMGGSIATLAIGEAMRPAAEKLAALGVAAHVFPSLTGLKAVDAFVTTLMKLSGADVPATVRRDRARLSDAMLDAHFHIGGLKVAMGAEPDLGLALGSTLAAMGAELTVVTTTGSRAAERIPTAEVIVGDLGDLERAAEAGGCKLLLTHAHGRMMAERLHMPHVRAGFPIFDRLGAQDACRTGYRGTRAFLYEIANAVLSHPHRPRPEDFGAARISPEFDHAPPPPSHH
ncbi:nitrogenase iron-molybdenum cofactor biosynthesis protein NifN [Cereibacter sphaeroides]|uniref:nitrogenase iron-molybdenum cofactor biosynthesis protein NifN n=1 Tax=Cereibacter sphaeroides TaxID=1063 RepID=UPI001F3F0B35|nr:nitrogenase iron-molybdenum cofactor biosynthesis protein NifN [Cereibacter sphaeroides]MCE6958206.1 nitrogenase iron-molybdenum cofactor biosynthesis protein NifN [Cereibacter sphaeroides]MCE6967685.1 nitrogenase iron-molybdenum cofactor biosynthesis protein NifN [Cereibacter sphaeroides]MCE6972496.1 nitrogenase iron-molybdenum cofactor biosynthesis protein NifN [Cereibacter sphaeroides]